MIEVELPDGTVLSFPEGMSKEDMEAAIQGFIASGPTAASNRQNPAPAPAPAPEPDRVGGGEALTRGLESGASFGFNDNITGLMAGVLGAHPEEDGSGYDYFDYSDSFGDRYSEARDKVRGELDVAREEHPYATFTGELGGGVATSMLALPGRAVGAGAQTLRQALPGMVGRGAGEGAVNMVGMMDTDLTSPTGIASAGLQGAALGAGLALGAPAVAAGGRAILDPIVGAAHSLFNLPYRGRAARTLAATFQRGGKSPEEVARLTQEAADEGQDAFVTADALGYSGQRALAGVARQPGEGRQATQTFLRDRQLGQGERLNTFVQDQLGPTRSAERELALLRGERSAHVSPIYDEAAEGADPVNLSGVLMTLDDALRRDPIVGESSLAKSELGNRLAALRSRMANDKETLIDFRDVLQIKSDLGTYIAEHPGLPPVYGQLLRQLDAALAQSSDRYRVANDLWRTRSQGIDAVEMGQEATGNRRIEDALFDFQGLPPPAQGPISPDFPRPHDAPQGFRTGYANERLGKIERNRPELNNARQFRNPRDEALMEAMGADPALFSRQIDREQTMFDTAHEALGGSGTAQNTADSVDMNGTNAGLGVLANLLAGRGMAAGGDAFRAIASAGTGINEETRNLIAQVLLSKDPQAVMAELMRTATRNSQEMAAAEALLRHLGYANQQGRVPQ